MIILFIGDIIGRPGRELLRKGLAALVERHRVDCVIANAENSAAGFGITKDIGDTILSYGVDAMTSESSMALAFAKVGGSWRWRVSGCGSATFARLAPFARIRTPAGAGTRGL